MATHEAEKVTNPVHRGSCLCGKVKFQVVGELPRADACHCTQCRKHTGHYSAGTDVRRTALTVEGNDFVSWYRIENVRRGFCSICGSSLFFDPDGTDWIGIYMGSFDTPTNTSLSIHIFTKNKGDYYEIDDGVPQHESYPGAPPNV